MSKAQSISTTSSTIPVAHAIPLSATSYILSSTNGPTLLIKHVLRPPVPLHQQQQILTLQTPQQVLQQGVVTGNQTDRSDRAKNNLLHHEEEKQKPNINKHCKFYNTPKGCRKGSSCDFLHILNTAKQGGVRKGASSAMEATNRSATEKCTSNEATSQPTDMCEVARQLQKAVRFLTEEERKALTLDMVIVMDCTGSMQKWIDSAKSSVMKVIDDVQKRFSQKATIRVGFVAYRDYDIPAEHIKVAPLTSDIDKIKTFVSREIAKSGHGRDTPEDIPGGLQAALRMDWQANAKLIILVADAPCHGRKYHDLRDDNYPQGHPTGPNIESQMIEIATKAIGFVFIDVRPTSTAKMIPLLQGAYDSGCKTIQKKVRHSQVKNAVVFKVVPFQNMIAHFSRTASDPELSLFMLTLIESATSSLEESATRSIESLTRKLQNQRSSISSKLSSLSIKEEVDDEEQDDEPDIPPTSNVPTSKLNWELMKHLHSENAIRNTYWLNIQDVDAIEWATDPFKYLSHTQQRTTVRILRSSFNEGHMRTAHGLQDEHIRQHLVAKVYKTQKNRDCRSYQIDAKVQSIARGLAQAFSKHPQSVAAIDFISVSYYELIDRPNNDQFKFFAAEPFMPGKYIKYNNNAGWVASTAVGQEVLNEEQQNFGKIAQAFSHFTWEYTQSHLHVVDLQGVDNILTDPQIHSKVGGSKLGKGDIGHWGTAMFFKSHVCNEYCTSLGLKHPTGNTATNTIPRLAKRSPNVQLCCELYCGTIFSMPRTSYLEELGEGRGVFCGSCKEAVKTDMEMAYCVNCKKSFKFKAYWYRMKGMEPPKRCQGCKA